MFGQLSLKVQVVAGKVAQMKRVNSMNFDQSPSSGCIFLWAFQWEIEMGALARHECVPARKRGQGKNLAFLFLVCLSTSLLALV